MSIFINGAVNILSWTETLTNSSSNSEKEKASFFMVKLKDKSSFGHVWFQGKNDLNILHFLNFAHIF